MRGRSVLLFLSPFLLSFAAFSLFPLVASIALSFLDWSPLAPDRAAVVGFRHYARALGEPRFWGALRNTFIFVAGTIPFTTALALGLALLVREPLPRRVRTLFRAGFFVPSVVSMVVISLIWKSLYAPFGGLNAALRFLGLPAQRWLLDPDLALPAIMAMDVWASVGYYMILYLAGLEAIPDELYEAARVDGASAIQAFRYITLRLLLPTIVITSLLRTIWLSQYIETIFLMTGGGPAERTTTLPVYTFLTIRAELDFGYASAMALVLATALMAVAALYLVLLRRLEVEL